MAETTLYPSAVSIAWTGAPSGLGSVVGDPPQWTDDSDATFAEIHRAGGQDLGVARLEPTPTASEPVAAVAYLRVASDGPATPTVAVRVASLVPSTVTPGAHEITGDVCDGFHVVDPALGVHDIVVPLGAGDDFYEGTFSVFTEDEPQLTAGIANVASGSLRVYEARVVVTLLGGKAPACRKFPRDDSLGVGSGRHWPRPSTQQSSPRRGPTTTY